jgi:short-subunit dehydrogenase
MRRCNDDEQPALGYYNAAKFAVEGLSDALRQEVEGLGLKILLARSEAIRTFATRVDAGWAELALDRPQGTLAAGNQRGVLT